MSQHSKFKINPKWLWSFYKANKRCKGTALTLLKLNHDLHPEKTALIDKNANISYKELFELSISAITALKQLNVEKNTKITIAKASVIETVSLCFAGLSLGAIVQLKNSEELKSNEAIQRMHNEFDIILIDQDNTQHFRNFEKFKPILVLPNQRTFQSIKSLLCKGKIISSTSGSTGVPKKFTRNSSGKQFIFPFLALLKRTTINTCSTIYVGPPLHHGFGLSALFSGIAMQKTLVFKPINTLSQIKEEFSPHKIDGLIVVPVQLKKLKDEIGPQNNVKCIITGSAPISYTECKNTIDKFGFVLFNLFGTTESGFCFMANSQDLVSNPNTIGKPIKGVNTAITQAGELAIKSNWSIAKNKWIATGDLVYKNKQGYYFLKGRIDNMIISGGINIYPIELDQLLVKHPAVAECYSLGVPDENFGQRLISYVCINETQDKNITVSKLIEWVKENAPKHLVPKQLVFTKAIVKNELGKPDEQYYKNHMPQLE